MRFSPEEYAARVSDFQRALASAGVDVYLGSSPEHMNYLSGFDPTAVYFFQVMLLTPTAEQPILLTHRCEAELARAGCWIDDIRVWHHGEDPVRATVEMLRELGIGPDSSIGLELDNWYLKAATVEALRERLPGTRFVDVTGLPLEQRMIKSPAEIAYMRQAAALADLAMRTAAERIRPGVSEREVLAAVQHELALAGSEYPALPFIIGSGPRSGLFHALPSSRTIEAGDPVMVEFAGVVARYNSNIVRTVVAGSASARLRTLRAVVKESFDRGVDAIRPGAPVAEVDRVTREARRDYAAFIPARAGFGMELAYPPVWLGRPDLLETDAHVFEPGMVVSLEPSIAQYEGVTVIHGSNILVTEDGAEILHRTPEDLFELPAG